MMTEEDSHLLYERTAKFVADSRTFDEVFCATTCETEKDVLRKGWLSAIGEQYEVSFNFAHGCAFEYHEVPLCGVSDGGSWVFLMERIFTDALKISAFSGRRDYLTTWVDFVEPSEVVNSYIRILSYYPADTDKCLYSEDVFRSLFQ